MRSAPAVWVASAGLLLAAMPVAAHQAASPRLVQVALKFTF